MQTNSSVGNGGWKLTVLISPLLNTLHSSFFRWSQLRFRKPHEHFQNPRGTPPPSHTHTERGPPSAWAEIYPDPDKLCSSCSLPCPVNYKPADHYVQVLAVFPGQNISSLHTVLGQNISSLHTAGPRTGETVLYCARYGGERASRDSS